MAKKAKILEIIGEGFEDVVDTIIKKDDEKYMKHDKKIKKEEKEKELKNKSKK